MYEFQSYLPTIMPVYSYLEDSTLVAWGTILGFDFIQITNRYDELYTHYTDYYFEVEESFRGQPLDDGNGVIRIRVPGGESADTISENKGLNFIKGHRYLFFLENPFMGNGVYTEDQDYYTIVSIYEASEQSSLQPESDDPSQFRSAPDYFTSYSKGEYINNALACVDLRSGIADYNKLHPVKTMLKRKNIYKR